MRPTVHFPLGGSLAVLLRMTLARPSRRLRVAMFSHAFQEPENRKHIVALGEQVDMSVITPVRFDLPEGDFKVGRFDVSQFAEEHYLPVRRLPVFPSGVSSHHALGSISFGFRQHPPDVIQIDHEPWSPVFWQALASRRAFAGSARVIMSPKKNTYRAYRGALGALKFGAARAGLRSVDLILAASRMTAALYRDRFGFPEERIRVATHVPVDVHTFSPPEPKQRAGPPVVGFSGRFHPQKGVLDLVDAAERCHAAGYPITLRLLGSGALGRDLERLSRERDWLEVLDAVPVDRVAPFMRELDIFAAPTRIEPDHQEHDGHAVLQALATGLPCVGTRSGILPEILDEKVGILVDDADPGALADGLIALADDPKRREQLGRSARRRAEERYSVERVTAVKVAVYESLWKSRE